MQTFDLIVVGGGAAGFFGAIQAAERKPGRRILILEKTGKLLAKVKVSGGGRCNVTHHCFEPGPLAKHYPRGEKALKTLFKKFQAHHVVQWFEAHGVPLKAEADGRMFPVTDRSQTIIDCFLRLVQQHRIQIENHAQVIQAAPMAAGGFTITCQDQRTFQARQLLIATGGSPDIRAYEWLRALGHAPARPIPSLFTFNDAQKQFKDLMGVAVPQAEVRIAGTKFSQQGPLLITHWGLSGPAVIKLSAWAAQYLHEQHYQFTALVSWTGAVKEDAMRSLLQSQKEKHPKQKIVSNPLFGLPSRLWTKLCELAEISEPKIWAELPQRNSNKLLEALIRCPFQIKGKTTFKEEFVTCGGIPLTEINLDTMESKQAPGLFFAGEVLHIDGETGGFNFQAAWTTSYVAAGAMRDS